jgi:hypothetical protein
VTFYERLEQQLSDTDTSTSTRRGLLERAGKASLGIAFVLAGLSRSEKAGAAIAGGAGCCVLAYQTDCPHCSGRGYDCGSGCTRWAWYCVDSARHIWLCGECYSGGNCAGCSCGRDTGIRNSLGHPHPGG